MVSTEDTMMDTQPCAALLANDLKQLYAILKSDAAQLFLLVLATGRTFVLYLGRSRYPEARQLACAIVITSVLAVLAAALAAQVPTMIRQIAACKAQELPARIALRKQ